VSEPSPHIVIAIDGPAASGKSSVARALARQLGIAYINTGAMYRAVTWHALRAGVSSADPCAVIALMGRTQFTCGVDAQCESTFLIDGTDPTAELLSEAINANVSQIAAIAEVRRVLVDLQRTYAHNLDVVMEGRDIGSAVFPETKFKFYIDASAEVRAQRRARQGLQDSILNRDKLDSARRASPLIIAEDAHVIDSSYLTIDGVAGEIVGRLKQKGLGIAPTRAPLLGLSAGA
jgi:cytidylate kinase